MAAACGRGTGGIDRLRRRADFLAAKRGRKAHSALMTLEMLPRDEARLPRLGFTVTRRVGTAVERNRIRRRLRAAAATALVAARPGCDYVIVARRGAIDAAFARLVGDLERAVQRVHATKSGAKPTSEEAPERA
ncbi:MAG TPA: ribonuclease P protein component [Hyphomicrobiales bacterium]|nr:ribonuclease P protein component [Hyphomicrobiales bacterium]